jgi:hypothetical protein
MARRVLSRGIAVIIISFLVVASSVVAGYGGVDNNDESQEQQHRISSRFTSALNLVGNDVGPSSPSSLRAAVPEEEDEDDTMIMGDGISSRGSSSRQRRELSWWSIVIQARKCKILMPCYYCFERGNIIIIRIFSFFHVHLLIYLSHLAQPLYDNNNNNIL